jgi:hypothetical protein
MQDRNIQINLHLDERGAVFTYESASRIYDVIVPACGEPTRFAINLKGATEAELREVSRNTPGVQELFKRVEFLRVAVQQYFDAQSESVKRSKWWNVVGTNRTQNISAESH